LAPEPAHTIALATANANAARRTRVRAVVLFNLEAVDGIDLSSCAKRSRAIRGPRQMRNDV
jgi:predicted alternative tryptophan synthase beta-subunit